MTHDPLCEWAECVCPRDYDVPERGHLVHCPDQYCECDFIVKVRADERGSAIERILEDVAPYGPEFDRARDDRTTAWLIQDEVIAAIRGEQP